MHDTMKNTFNTIMLAAALMLGAGCTSEFLTVENPMAAPIEEYFTTPEHLGEALTAAYDPLEWTDWGMGQYSPVMIMSDIMADQIWVGGADKTDNQFWHLMMNYEATPTNTLSALWTNAYSGIKRCNDVIKYMEWTEGLSADVAKSYEAQVRVLRVYYYSWLWKFYGNVPYYTVNLEDPWVCAQSTADQVYDGMMTDLEEALKLNALPMRCSGAELGRVTKAMAYMLYAELAMYKNDSARMDTAFSYMKEIIDSKQYSLADDYRTIFTLAGEHNSESIFEITYKSENAVRGWSWALGAGGTVLPRLIGPYNLADATGVHLNGWGFAPVRTETFEMYDPSDERRDATCWDASGLSYDKRYQDTGLFLEKYAPRVDYSQGYLSDADFGFGNNFRIYRYAETLLNAAELVVTGHGSGDAQGWLNEVHSRSLDGKTVELSLANIKEERKLEFVGEGKRYWDLIRWGDASSVLVPDAYGYRTNTWSESKKYLPIPQSEIDASASTSEPLTQNNY